MLRPGSITWNKETQETILEILLPKNWLLSDFDPKENKIEIEDTSDGERYWIDPNQLFRFWGKLEIGAKRKVADFSNWIMFDAYLSKFDGEIRKKRCYLKAIFLPFGALETIDSKTAYAKTSNVIYEGLYQPALSQPERPETL